MKLFWEFSDFQVYGCCKNSQFFFLKWSSLTSGVPWQMLFDVWPYQGRRYLTSDGLWQTLNCSGFSLILARKLTSVLLVPTLDNVGLLKDRRQVTSAIFSTLFWRHPIRRRCLGRRQRSKMSDVKRFFCVSEGIPEYIVSEATRITHLENSSHIRFGRLHVNLARHHALELVVLPS